MWKTSVHQLIRLLDYDKYYDALNQAVPDEQEMTERFEDVEEEEEDEFETVLNGSAKRAYEDDDEMDERYVWVIIIMG